MVRNSTIFFPFPAPITVSASPARFASFSNCTEIPVIFSNSFVSSKLCHPGRFGGVKIIPLIKSNGPGQEIPIPSIFSPNPLITSLIWFNVFIGFFGSKLNSFFDLIFLVDQRNSCICSPNINSYCIFHDFLSLLYKRKGGQPKLSPLYVVVCKYLIRSNI